MKAEVEMLADKKAVIFDLDGTLIDSMWLWKEIDVEYLARYGISYPKELPDLIGGMSFSETAVFFKQYFKIPRSIDEIMDDWNRMAEYKYTHEISLKPGVKEFLCRIKTEGRKLGLATSNSRELAESVLKEQGIFDFFDDIVTSCEVGKGKPAPDVYLAVAKHLNISPEDCLVFEDVIDGILAGKNAGMTVCAVEDAYSSYQMEEKRKNADYLLADFNQIHEVKRLRHDPPQEER